MHKIDLNKYEIRTDMAIDIAEKNSDKFNTKTFLVDDVKVTHIKLAQNNMINKKPGTYITIEFDDITDDDSRKKVSKVFLEELKKMLSELGLKKEMNTMVIGLGNRKSTPDSLGPIVSEKIIVTKHFFDMNIDVDSSFSKVCSFYPGVTGITGIETSDFIYGVIKKVRPDLIIVVDALCSTSISRVNKSIQISDAGIYPGSGVGNKRKGISKEILGVPVVSIGIPTVVDAAVIVSDTISFMSKNYAYNKSHSKKSKLINKPVNYLKRDISVSNDDRKTLLGLVGLLNEEELINLTYEVLTPIGYNLMVTPKEVDFVIEKLSDVISYGINHSLHEI